MFEAAGKARDGDVGYFQALPAPELVSLLVGRDEDGRTLFHTAAAAGHLELLHLLIAAGSGKVANKHDDEVRLYSSACMHAHLSTPPSSKKARVGRVEDGGCPRQHLINLSQPDSW
jgi:ankyrin repeat protein